MYDVNIDPRSLERNFCNHCVLKPEKFRTQQMKTRSFQGSKCICAFCIHICKDQSEFFFFKLAVHRSVLIHTGVPTCDFIAWKLAYWSVCDQLRFLNIHFV